MVSMPRGRGPLVIEMKMFRKLTPSKLLHVRYDCVDFLCIYADLRDTSRDADTANTTRLITYAIIALSTHTRTLHTCIAAHN